MRHYGLLLGGMALLFLALFGLVEALEIPLLSDPVPWMQRGSAAVAAVGVGLLVADVFLPVPASLVMIAHGALFGVAGGTALSLLGALGAGWLGFGIGRYGSARLDRWIPADERRRGDALLDKWGAVAVVASRPVPILAETVAIVAGTSPMGWARMSLATLAGAAPAAAIYAFGGASIGSFQGSSLIFALVIALAAATWWLGKTRYGDDIPSSNTGSPSS